LNQEKTTTEALVAKHKIKHNQVMDKRPIVVGVREKTN